MISLFNLYGAFYVCFFATSWIECSNEKILVAWFFKLPDAVGVPHGDFVDPSGIMKC